MKQNVFWKKSIIGIFMALLILVCGGLLIGTAYGRYQKTYNETFTLTVRGANQFQILALDGKALSNNQWQRNEDGSITLDFLVNNQGGVSGAPYSLSVATTLGIGFDQGKISLITTNLNNQEVTYLGTPDTIAEESVLHYEMGPGYLYHFYNQNGNELCWNLKGEKSPSQSFTLKIEGTTQPGMIEIKVTEQALAE